MSCCAATALPVAAQPGTSEVPLSGASDTSRFSGTVPQLNIAIPARYSLYRTPVG